MAQQYSLRTVNGYDFWEASSAFQKAIRRGDEEEALYWAVEFYDQGGSLTSYCWNRMFVMTSEDIGLANPQLPQQIVALHSIFEHFKKGKNAHEPEKLHFIHAVLLLVRSPKSRLVDWALIDAFKNHKPGREVPDYALDKHTRRGKALGRGFPHFFEEGAKLENHSIQEGEMKYLEASREVLIGRQDFEKNLFGEEKTADDYGG